MIDTRLLCGSSFDGVVLEDREIGGARCASTMSSATPLLKLSPLLTNTEVAKIGSKVRFSTMTMMQTACLIGGVVGTL